MTQISSFKIILSFGCYAETKDSRSEFRTWSHIGAARQAFCESYSFVPPRSVGALVTLHYVGTVSLTKRHFDLFRQFLLDLIFQPVGII